MPIDHACITVPKAQFQEVLDFYLAALAPIGYKNLMQPVDVVVGLGVDKPDFWITGIDIESVNSPGHIGFSSMDRKLVDAFHEAAVAAGGKDNGAPGLRKYHPSYYGAFVYDPVGNNIEVVCHIPSE